jgi:ribonuclease P/MRP protein subunit POP5
MVRFKNRYLLVEMVWKDGRMDTSLNEAALLPVLRDSMAVNFGDHGLGMALASLSVKYYNPLTGLCVVRCSRDQFKEVCHLLCNAVIRILHREKHGPWRTCSCRCWHA